MTAMRLGEQRRFVITETRASRADKSHCVNTSIKVIWRISPSHCIVTTTLAEIWMLINLSHSLSSFFLIHCAQKDARLMNTQWCNKSNEAYDIDYVWFHINFHVYGVWLHCGEGWRGTGTGCMQWDGNVPRTAGRIVGAESVTWQSHVVWIWYGSQSRARSYCNFLPVQERKTPSIFLNGPMLGSHETSTCAPTVLLLSLWETKENHDTKTILFLQKTQLLPWYQHFLSVSLTWKREMNFANNTFSRCQGNAWFPYGPWIQGNQDVTVPTCAQLLCGTYFQYTETCVCELRLTSRNRLRGPILFGRKSRKSCLLTLVQITWRKKLLLLLCSFSTRVTLIFFLFWFAFRIIICPPPLRGRFFWGSMWWAEC